MKSWLIWWFIAGVIGMFFGGIWGYYEGDKHAACWVSDLESFEVSPVPDSSPFPPPGDPL